MEDKLRKKQNISCEGINFQVDNEGYLTNPDDWNEFVAFAIAKHEGISELTHEMFEILIFIRDYYKTKNVFPSLTFVAKSLRKSTGSVLQLFGNHAKAWKIAGLPHPENELSFLLGGF
jgi:tRNA 2-thiouridine synthesizing protein E